MDPSTLVAWTLAFLLVGVVFLVLCIIGAALVLTIRRAKQIIENDGRLDNGK
ncbi:hypothetical protein [Corynebacterium propinquum]